MEFQVGEKVIYPNHGIGVVESIQTRPIPGGKISLYQLRILSNDSRVWVPQQNADGVGLRPVISSSDVRKIFTLLGDAMGLTYLANPAAHWLRKGLRLFGKDFSPRWIIPCKVGS